MHKVKGAVYKAESKLGIDLNGDGHVGKPRPQQHGSGMQPGTYNPGYTQGSCPPGYTNHNGQCVPQQQQQQACPPGYVNSHGQCVPQQQPQKPGYHVQGGYPQQQHGHHHQQQAACPPGYTNVNGMCKPQQQQQHGHHHHHQQAACPPGYTNVNGTCKPQQQQQHGHVPANPYAPQPVPSHGAKIVDAEWDKILSLPEGFLRKDGSRASGGALRGKTVGVYCSAHWCPPCRQFTPQLAQFYEEYKRRDPNFEVVFVSSDRSKQDMLSYFQSHGNYLCCTFDGQARGGLQRLVKSSGIPCFAIFGPDGKMVTKEGRNGVSRGPSYVASHGWK